MSDREQYLQYEGVHFDKKKILELAGDGQSSFNKALVVRAIACNIFTPVELKETHRWFSEEIYQRWILDDDAARIQCRLYPSVVVLQIGTALSHDTDQQVQIFAGEWILNTTVSILYFKEKTLRLNPRQRRILAILMARSGESFTVETLCKKTSMRVPTVEREIVLSKTLTRLEKGLKRMTLGKSPIVCTENKNYSFHET